jgi:hypothetical protein
MIKTTKKINLGQLSKELNNAALNMAEKDGESFVESCDQTITQVQLEKAIDNHIAVFEEASVEQKLASVGLNLDDLKAALGL